LELDKIICLEN